MPNLNRVQIMGHAGRDAELDYTGGGKPFVKLSIATNRKNRNGEMETAWHRVTIWGSGVNTAAIIKKGDGVYVEGSIEYSSYTDPNGEKRRAAYIAGFTCFRLDYRSKAKEEPDKPGEWGTPDFAEDDAPF